MKNGEGEISLKEFKFTYNEEKPPAKISETK
jgi:hypothetical protein